MRNKEITGKAITASLILLLKWFKISRESPWESGLRRSWLLTMSTDVLKFEFFTQLLLDAGFLTFVLKIFAMHDVQHVVENRTDRIEER